MLADYRFDENVTNWNLIVDLAYQHLKSIQIAEWIFRDGKV